MLRQLVRTLWDRIDAAMTRSGIAFMDAWTVVGKTYRRPLARSALRLKFAFYPILAVFAIAWLVWDWNHDHHLGTAEDAIFDMVVQWRPIEPKPSGRTLIVEIDDCSIEYFRRLGEGGWPWSRQRHADLLEALDRAGVRAVGYDVLFADPSVQDPVGDAMLEEMAKGGQGRFVFASTRLHPDYDQGALLHAADAPGAFALTRGRATQGPTVALLLPYGSEMARASGLVNVTRNKDGVLRDIHLREVVGNWALPSLPLRLAAQASGHRPARYGGSVRVNWRGHARLPYLSAADLIAGKPVCHSPHDFKPALKDAIVLVGSTAAGINDAKPTPVNASMPGVEVLAEATEALVAGSGIWMPPEILKYLLAAFIVMLTTFAFWRGEPHEDVDSIFLATNLAMLLIAFGGLTFFGIFLDIFASVGFISLCFALCRIYAGIQRGRAIGNVDYLVQYDPQAYPWLVMARLRFAPKPGLDPKTQKRARREYRRLLRRFLYAGGSAVMIEGIVERKSWLHEILDDLMILIWKGEEQASTRALAQHDLDSLYRDLNRHDEHLDRYGEVRICVLASEIDDSDDENIRGERMRLRELLGQDLNLPHEWPLSAANTFVCTNGRVTNGREQEDKSI